MSDDSIEPAAVSDALTIRFKTRGPDPAAVQRLLGELPRQPLLQKYLGENYQFLTFRLIDPDAPGKRETTAPAAPSRFEARYYSYSNHRTIEATGRLKDLSDLQVEESGVQFPPSAEEFEAATQLATRSSAVGVAMREQRVRPYPPMPPIVANELPDGRRERIVTVGLMPTGEQNLDRHEIIGVNLATGEVTRFEERAPGNSRAGNGICGLPDASQPTTRNVPGQAWVTVSKGGQVIWKFLVVRPAASSGTNGSGVELRYLDYKGKRVLYRAHVPILNVKYDGNACGPYRDWQNQEGMIQATGTDVAPGFRLCPSPAKTILDTGSDAGNFLGVGVYVQGQEVVLVSEMEAGWYRYVSEWRLHSDGTIRPRFGFSAVSSSCVCTRHHHHAYWRLDFDIRTAGGNRVREFNNPPLSGSQKWHTKTFEIKRFRDPARKRKWLVENIETGEGYEIIPGPNDGVATAAPDWPFPKGDLWILRYRGSEIDDGVVAVGPPYEAGLDAWVNGESIDNKDVVIWYGAHFTHDLAHEGPGDFGHIVGPTLKPVKW